MASYQKMPSGKWSVRFWMPSGSQKRLSGFKKKKEAEYAYRRYLAEHHEEPKDNSITFEELFEHYKIYAKSELKAGTYVTNESKARLYVLPFFEKKKVKDISPALCLRWKQDIQAKGFSTAYNQGIYHVFSAIMKFGNDFYDLDNNSLMKVPNFKKIGAHKEMQYWTEEEFKTFIAEVDDSVYKALFSLLFLSGCRRGEALALKWEDYNEDKIRINKSVTYISDGENGYRINSPKTQSSVRTVALPAQLCTILNEVKANTNGDYIFNGAAPFPKVKVYRAFSRYVEKSKVKPIRLHDLRHSHATLLFNKGMDALQIARRLGHTDVTQLLNRYAHLLPSREKGLIEALNIDI